MKSFTSACRTFSRATLRNAELVVAVFAVLLVCLPLFSQTNQGTIQGGVFDQTGGAVAGATVTVIDVARGISRPLTTDSAGQYVALNLTPGTYTVRAETKGFQTVEHQNVLVEVGENVRVDLTLQPGAQTQTVTVTEEVPAIDSTDAVLGGTVSNQAINALPLNGRNFLKLLDLRPGSVIELGGTEGAGTSNNTSFNGLRVQDNLFLVEGLPQFSPDGQPIVNQALGGQGSVLSIDAIQEFHTEENPKAEYGWKDGGVVDVGIKSGTNSIHGTAFAFGRDNAWDASEYFTGIPTPVALEQFGQTSGGRIIKDKIFWFTSYESQRYTVGDAGSPTMPSDIALSAAQDPTNQLSMINACNAVTSTVHGATTGPYNAIGVVGTNGTLSALSARLAGISVNSSTGCSVAPASSTFENVFLFNGTTNLNVFPSLSTVDSINAGLIKGDYHISDHNHIDGSYYRSYQSSLSYGGNATQPQWGLNAPCTVPMASGAWTYTPNSAWVNEFRGGYATIYCPRAPADVNMMAGNPWPNGYGINTGVTNPLYGGFPTMSISPFTGGFGGGGSGVRGPEGNIDFLDHLSYLRGKHAFKFGVEYMFQVFLGDTYKNSQGTVSFSSLQNFLTGTAKSASINVGNPALDAGSEAYGLFAQDDWRITTKVILNLGLRWEYYTPPKEQNNYIGNFNPNVNPLTTSALQQAGGSFAPLYKGDPWQFSPRFGLAWDVKGNGRTVVRAGAGLLYNIPVIGDNIDTLPFGANIVTPNLIVNNSGTAISEHTPEQFTVPVGNLNWNLAGPVFPTAGPTVINGVPYTGVTCTIANPCGAIAMDPNMKAPRTAEWNIDVQRAITNSLTVAAAYVGNHQFDGLSRNDLNQPLFGAGWNNPSASLPGGVSPAACIVTACTTTKNIMTAEAANVTAARPFQQFPYLNYITFQSNQWYSSYEGLQISATERASRGLTFLAGYTHDRSYDFTTSGGWGGPYNQDSRNVSHDYGPSGLDVQNRFTFSTTYDVPAIKSPAQLLKGWAVNAIWVMQGGIPWYPQDSTSDLQGTGEYNDSTSPASQFWNFSGPASAFRSAPHNVPCFGNLSGCTAYIGGLPPQNCVTAAEAPYAGNAQLTALALAALTNLGCYVQGGGILTPPAYGTIGNASRGSFHAPPFYNVDLSISKDWKYKERYTAQFRAEFFNVLNRADFAPPGTKDPEKGLGFGCSCATADTGDPVLGAGGARSIQIGLKLIF